MELRAQLFLPCKAGDHLRRELLRLKRSETDAGNFRNGTGCLDRAAEIRVNVLPVSGEVDPGEHHLAVPLTADRGNFRLNFIERFGAHTAAGVRDDAVRTEPVAAVLNLDERARAFVELRDGHRFKFLAVLMRGNVHNPVVGGEIGENIGKQRRAVGIAEHHVGLRKRFGRFRKRLRHTAGQHDDGVRIIAAGAAERLADLLIAGGCHRAGVDQHHIGDLPVRTDSKACCAQLADHCLRFILIDLASKGDCGNLHVKKILSPSVGFYEKRV